MTTHSSKFSSDFGELSRAVPSVPLTSASSVEPWHTFLLSVLPPFILSAAAFLLCRSITTTLPLYFCPFAIITLILPATTLSQSTLFRQALCAAAPVDAIALLTLPALFSATISPTQWILYYLLLTIYAATLWGIVRLFISLRLSPPLAAATTILLSFAWLTWPLWTSAFITAPIITWLIPPHPIFATNSLLHPPFGIWTESPFPYRLTTLNQDLPYSLPATILPALITHTIFAALSLTAALLLSSRRHSCEPPPANQ